MAEPVAAKRNRYGQRYYPVPNPVTHEIHDLPSWSRLKSLLHSGALEVWKLKTVARTIAIRDDLQILAANEQDTYTAVKSALNASQQRANTGTGIHRFTEMVDDGSTIDWEFVPTAAAPYLRNYIDKKAEIGWEAIKIEATIYNLEAGYAGTADRFMFVPGYGIVTWDLKTGEDVWPDTALQLAAYANAEGLWIPPTDADLPQWSEKSEQLKRDIAEGTNFTKYGSPRARKWSEAAQKKAWLELEEIYWQEFSEYPGHKPMPEGLRTDIGIVCHLTKDGCKLYPYKLDKAYEAIQGLTAIFKWQESTDSIIQEVINAGNSSGDSASSDSTSVNSVVPDGATSLDSTSAFLESLGLEDSKEPLEPESQELDKRGSEPAVNANWLIARIAAMPQEVREELAKRWPEDMPTFKQTTDHTPEQLQKLDQIISSIESKFELPFVTNVWSEGYQGPRLTPGLSVREGKLLSGPTTA